MKHNVIIFKFILADERRLSLYWELNRLLATTADAIPLRNTYTSFTACSVRIIVWIIMYALML